MKTKSRTKRWQEALARVSECITMMRGAHEQLELACSELREIQEEYEQWKDGLPDNLQSSALAEKLEAVCDLDIESLAESVANAIDEAENTAGEAEGIDLPLGFGRD